MLDEVHWLMVNAGTRFVLSGSSPRKIIRSEANLLGGRALRYELFPLVSHEIPDFDLLRALNNGLLPRHYLSDNPEKLISAYIGNYLKDGNKIKPYQVRQIRNILTFYRLIDEES